jgi:hypothetical protein
MRAAPLGAVPPEVVTAVFYNFHPDKVARALPDAWEVASPQAFLATRLSGVDGALRRMLPADVLAGKELAEVANLLREAAEHAPMVGRPLGAANAALPWPAEPHLVAWQAATILRESRGDGHVAALLTAGLDPVETLVMFGVDNGLESDFLQTARGWSVEEWTSAQDRLIARGLLTQQAELTTEGMALRRWIEDRTDRSATAPWQDLGEEGTARLVELLTPVALMIAQANEAMAVNPLGLSAVTELAVQADGAG